MALFIKLNNDFVITSSPFALVLCLAKEKGKESKNVGEQYLEKIGEYSSLEGVLNGYLFYSIIKSDCSDVKELKELIKEVKAEIKELSNIEKGDK
ncbi:MAG: hypothetical protein GY714_18285 [Desulfobacterales bacterium]|nr:hypothetical protein [Desulfobacterales bacterium]